MTVHRFDRASLIEFGKRYADAFRVAALPPRPPAAFSPGCDPCTSARPTAGLGVALPQTLDPGVVERVIRYELSP